MRNSIATALALSLSVSGAHAATRTTYLTGNTLYAACTPIIGEATGYVLGVVDTQAQAEAQGLTPLFPLCIPQGVTGSQLADVTCVYLRDHPSMRHQSASLITVIAIATAFPCQ
ncbi:Rap1a/Tai family immunity protein [Phyllobacterium zundukense]|uniref:Rap1a/Tai family immunity protein n=1 Tax=Phyllobacterium zundukense TaxID=1867719 RepID=UPI003965B47D